MGEREGIKILYIEDEEGIVKPVTKFLKNYGYCIQHASSGKEAIKKLNEESYNLVILDLTLPDINGEEIYSFIEREHPETSIIITTGDTTYQHSSLRILYKPFTLLDILNTIRDTMETTW